MYGRYASPVTGRSSGKRPSGRRARRPGARLGARRPSLQGGSWSSTGLTVAAMVIGHVSLAVERRLRCAVGAESGDGGARSGSLFYSSLSVFRHTGVDRGYGMLSMASASRCVSVTLGMPCERVSLPPPGSAFRPTAASLPPSRLCSSMARSRRVRRSNSMEARVERACRRTAASAQSPYF